MSNVIVAPQALAAAATDLSGVGSALTAANAPRRLRRPD